MTNKFKAGDKVRVIKPETKFGHDGILVLGSEWVIERVDNVVDSPFESKEHIYLKGYPSNLPQAWFPKRFELVPAITFITGETYMCAGYDYKCLGEVSDQWVIFQRVVGEEKPIVEKIDIAVDYYVLKPKFETRKKFIIIIEDFAVKGGPTYTYYFDKEEDKTKFIKDNPTLKVLSDTVIEYQIAV